MKIIRALLAALLISGNAHAAATVMDYNGAGATGLTSDGSFLLDSTNLNAKDYFYSMYCVDLNRSVQYIWTGQSQKWNNAAIGSQDPGSNVGGRSLSGLSAGPYYAAVGGIDNPTIYVTNFGAGTPPGVGGLPSGYSWWGSSTTWNPSDKGANVTLSNGNLTASFSTGWQLVRATTSITGTTKACYSVLSQVSRNMRGIANATASTGSYPGSDTNGTACYNLSSFPNWFQGGDTGVVCNASDGTYRRRMFSNNAVATGNRCAEVTLTAIGTTANASTGSYGVANTSLAMQGTAVGGDANGTGYNPIAGGASGNSVFNSGSNILGVGTVNQGTIVMLCINSARTKFWVYSPVSANWNGDVIGNQNPATNTGGVTVPSGTLYWAMSFFEVLGATNITWNFGATSFSNTLPSGFCSQDATSCGGGGSRSRGYNLGANDNWPPVIDRADRCEIVA